MTTQYGQSAIVNMTVTLDVGERNGPDGERGFFAVVALLFSFVVLAYSASIINAGLATNNYNRYFLAKRRALAAAESGIHHTIALVNGPQRENVLALQPITGILKGTVGSKRAVRYEVGVASGANDGVDNDMDGLIDEWDESEVYEITSTGWADNVARTVRVTLVWQQLGLDAAIGFTAPTEIDIEIKEIESFNISGNDVDIDGVPTGFAAPGIGVTGDPVELISQIPAHIRSMITGYGPSPSILEIPAADPHLLQALIDAARAGPHITLEEDSFGTYGTVDNPAVVIGGDELEFKMGTLRGVGLLILEGKEVEFKKAGSLDWKGLVIIRLEEEIEVKQGATFSVRGAVIIDTSSDEEDPEYEIEFKDEAEINIEYSRQAVALAMRAFRKYRVINWREASNPETTGP